MKKASALVTLVMVLVMVATSAMASNPTDMEVRLSKVGDGKILAEIWETNRYFYIVEYEDRTEIIDSSMNYYYGIYATGFSWDAEARVLTKIFETDWQVQENRYIADEDVIFLGQVGGDAGIEYAIPFEWAVGEMIMAEDIDEILEYDLSCRLISVHDGVIMAEQMDIYGDWCYVVWKDDGRVLIMDALLEVLAEIEELDEADIERIDWDYILSSYLEDDVVGIIIELFGEDWDDLVFEEFELDDMDFIDECEEELG